MILNEVRNEKVRESLKVVTLLTGCESLTATEQTGE